jgi:hypothetical protein
MKVAEQLKLGSISTAANQYRSAFKMIAGHDFRPELWWHLFGPLKFSELVGGAATALAAQILHRLRSPVRRPIPDSKVSPLSDQPHGMGLVERGSAIRDPNEYVD